MARRGRPGHRRKRKYSNNVIEAYEPPSSRETQTTVKPTLGFKSMKTALFALIVSG